jgi:hypothetical protein
MCTMVSRRWQVMCSMSLPRDSWESRHALKAKSPDKDEGGERPGPNRDMGSEMGQDVRRCYTDNVISPTVPFDRRRS